MKLHEKYGDLNKWTKTQLARFIVRHQLKQRRALAHPRTDAPAVLRLIREEKKALVYRAELVFNHL